jgi:aspartate carbamoyltransferase catalytic subunit
MSKTVTSIMLYDDVEITGRDNSLRLKEKTQHLSSIYIYFDSTKTVDSFINALLDLRVDVVNREKEANANKNI